MFGLELGFVMDLFAYLGIGAKKEFWQAPIGLPKWSSLSLMVTSLYVIKFNIFMCSLM